MKTLSGIVNSYADNLIVRAADVVLKERRKLVLMPRETPLHAGHCKMLYEATQLGAEISPPMPAFYNDPQTIDDLINHNVGRVLDLLGLGLHRDIGALQHALHIRNRVFQKRKPIEEQSESNQDFAKTLPLVPADEKHGKTDPDDG